MLRRRARPLSGAEITSGEIQGLIQWMHETMQDAPGVGLAAPQIGVGLRVAVIEDKAEYTKDAAANMLMERERSPVPFHVIINPVVTLHEGEQPEFFEGCLSLSGFTAVVPRARKVTVECLDERGEPKVIEASGWYARILQHEIDHLDGTLYLDRMHTRTFMSVDNFNRYWKDKPVAEVTKLLRES